LLGKGGFAKVYWCTSVDSGKNYAVKIVPKANLVKTRARQKLQAEIKIHRVLKHRRVVEYKHFFEDRYDQEEYGVIRRGGRATRAPRTERCEASATATLTEHRCATAQSATKRAPRRQTMKASSEASTAAKNTSPRV